MIVILILLLIMKVMLEVIIEEGDLELIGDGYKGSKDKIMYLF